MLKPGFHMIVDDLWRPLGIAGSLNRKTFLGSLWIADSLLGSLDCWKVFGSLRIAGVFPFEFFSCWRSLIIVLNRWRSLE